MESRTNRRRREGAERFLERRRREGAAPRLLALFPRLQALRFQISEHRADASLAEAPHTRLIVVASAPALFVFPCQDAGCEDGGHDVTVEVYAALRGSKIHFAGEDRCRGQVGSGTCSRVLKYVAAAVYRE